MIETSQWRACIGQFGACSHHVVSVSQSLYHWDRVSTDAHLSPVCALVIAVALLMSGDIESNPGPNGKKAHGVQQKAGIAAERILQKRIVIVTQVVKSGLDLFHSRLKEEFLVAEGLVDLDNKIMTKADGAVVLYSACMTAVKVDPSKFSIVLDILREYPLLVETVHEMAQEGVETGLLKAKLDTVSPIQEIIMPSQSAGQEERDLMEKYRSEKFIKYKSLKCTFTGPPRVGKTTTLRRLIGEITNIKTMPHASTTESTVSSEPLTFEMYEESRTKTIMLTQSRLKPEDGVLGEMVLLFNYDGEDQADPELVGGTSGTLQHDAESVSSTASDVHSQDLSDNYVQKLINELLEQNMYENIEEIGKTYTIYIMDCGGQPEFQEFLPIVLRGPALHLVFFDASSSLKDPVHVKFCSKEVSFDGSPSIEYKTSYTTCEILFQIISSLYCLSKYQGSEFHQSSQALPKFRPTCLLVGTHIDKEACSVDDVSKDLEDLFKGTEFSREGFLPDRQSKPIFYPVDNLNGTNEEIQELIGFILNDLIKNRLTSTPLPRSWFVLHIALRHRYKDSGWCHFKDCVELAAQCHIPEEDVKGILSYVHNHIGNVLHYADVPYLKDIVICDPNKLLKAINSVVIRSFLGDATYRKSAEEIRKTGEISRVLQEELESPGDDKSKPFSNRGVISLLKHFNIIIELTTGDDALFVPCLLLPKRDPSVRLPTEDELKDMVPKPLLIQFEGGYIPFNIFSGLAIQLLRNRSLELNKTRFRDHLTFVYNCKYWSFQLIKHFHFLEVRIVGIKKASATSQVHDCCKVVLECLQQSLLTVLSLYEHTKKTKVNLGFYCPETSCASNRHFCKFCELKQDPVRVVGDEAMRCAINQEPCNLEDRFIWFKQEVDLNWRVTVNKLPSLESEDSDSVLGVDAGLRKAESDGMSTGAGASVKLQAGRKRKHRSDDQEVHKKDKHVQKKTKRTSQKADSVLAQCLSKPCTDLHLSKIARSMTEWTSIAVYFRIEQPEVQAIRQSYPSFEDQKFQMLMKWKEKLGKAATYKKIIKVFQDLKNQRMVDKIKVIVLKQ